MTDFGAWIQENWYQLGSFFVQCGFLFLALWFAGKILRTLRESQEQVGALLKLSVTGNAPAPDHHSDAHVRAASEASSYWLPPSQPTTAFVTSKDNPFQSAPSHPGLLGWLRTPMSITTGTSSFHRVLRWLQSPASI